MRRIVLLAVAVTAAVAAGYGSALAQRIGVEVYGGPQYRGYDYDDPDYYVRPGARVYGYYRDDDVVVVRPAIRPANCGEYHYWDGTHCADARIDPPDVD